MNIEVGSQVIISKPRIGFEWLKDLKSKVIAISQDVDSKIPPIELENEYYVYEDEVELIK